MSDTPGAPSPPDAKAPLTALEAIAKAEASSDAVFVLKDFHHCLDKQPKIIRESGVLEFFTPQETIADIGGLEVLRDQEPTNLPFIGIPEVP